MLKSNIKIFTILILFISFTSCKPDPEEIFHNAILDYKETESDKNKAKLIKIFINETSKGLLKYTKPKIINNLLVVEINDKKSIITPEGSIISIALDDKHFSYDRFSKNLVVSDGFFIKIINSQKKVVKQFKLIDNDKISIDALSYYKNNIYYFYKRQIYSLNLITDKKTKYFENKIFSPPYKKNSFNVQLRNNSKFLLVTTGLAGLYNYSLLDLNNNKIIKKDFKVVSSRFLLKENELYFLSGKGGNWQLKEYNLINNKISILTTFSELKNLYFLSTKKSLNFTSKEKYIYDLNFDTKLYLPNTIKIIGALNNYFIINYNNLLYLANYEKFILKLNIINRQVPDFFSEID